MSLEPRWNERISKTGRPEQPLRANTVRIRMEQTISRGITTDVRARGRYFSSFCWAMYRVSNSSITADLPKADKRDLLEGIEEILGLASYYRQLTKEEQQDGLSGVTGSSNISDDSLYDGETIDLDSFTLLSNSPYAIFFQGENPAVYSSCRIKSCSVLTTPLRSRTSRSSRISL